MKLPEERVVKFINEHHVMTVACSQNNQPWCWNAFYVYIQDLNCFVFTSDDKTRHVQEIENNNKISASIVLETETVGKIRGLQMEGLMVNPEKEIKRKIRLAYLKRFPYAALMNTDLWILSPNYMKMTDNRLGFGKKLIWKK